MKIFESLDALDSIFSTPRKLEWAAVKAAIRWKFPAVRQMSTDMLADLLAASDRIPPLLLDARTPEEYAVSHLKDVHLADTVEKALALLQGIERDHPVIVYCSVGYRSAELANHLQTNGFTNIYNLEGSIFTWANEGRPLYRGNQRVYVAHPYNDRWGQLLDKALWAKTA